MEFQKSNETPLENTAITFISNDKKHHEAVITNDQGKCTIELKQNKHYTIHYDVYKYKRMTIIPKTATYNYPIPIIIDEGIFATAILDYTDYNGNPVINEWVKCTDNNTGNIYEDSTDENGQINFYIPRGHSYTFANQFDTNLRTYTVKEAKGYAIYSVKIRVNAQSTEQYKKGLEDWAIWTKKQQEEQRKNDSIAKITPVKVLLFLNSDDGELYSKVKVYTQNKETLIGNIDAHWTVEGLCERNSRLCLGSFGDNKDFTSHIEMELLEGTHIFHVESKDGSLNKDIEVKIERPYSFYGSDQLFSVPICL